MRIPQLFIRTSNNKFVLVSHPIKNKPLYFWDEFKQQIVPAKGKLQMQVVEGCPYLVLGEDEERTKDFRCMNSYPNRFRTT